MNSLDVSLICKVLSDSNRLQIIQLLQSGQKCACELLNHFEITQPTLSHHMKILLESGLVDVSKKSKWSYYSLNQKSIIEFTQFFDGIVNALETL